MCECAGTTRTSSSVVFGFDAVDYETDAQARQKDILSAARADRVDGKAMKKASGRVRSCRVLTPRRRSRFFL